jgi:hypothetical protein
MAYYDALIAEWPNITGPDTATKLATLNALQVTGSIPTTFSITGQQILNCLDFTEFNTRTASQQTAILQLCALPAMVAGQNTFIGKLFASYYSNALGGPTITAFIALAKAITQPWWQANGYPRAFDLGDIAAAGLS